MQEVAAARGCDQLARRVTAGQMYKGAAGWETKGAGGRHLPGCAADADGDPPSLIAAARTAA